MPTVRGTAYWASVTKPNVTFEPVYTIDVVLDQKQKDQLISAMEDKKEAKADQLAAIKKDEEKGGWVVKIKQKVKVGENEDGSPKIANPPRVFLDDDNQTPFSGNVGNGSDVSVLFTIYRSTYKNKGYISLGLRAVKIHDLVKFESEVEEEEFFGKSQTPVKATKSTDDFFDDEIDFK